MNKLILLDSNSLLHRAYHALPALVNSKGQFTGAVYGFMNMLVRLIEEEKPDYIAAAFDLKAPTFRHKLFEGYKGTRKPMPDDLVPQVPLIKQLLTALNITIVEKEGYEADDILGTLANKFSCPTLIVTGDRDALQLVSPSTHVYLTIKGIKEVELYNENRLLEDGFTPEMFIDYKALRGDASDNVPGIKGVGEKTAKDLIEKYKTLENVLAAAPELKGKLSEKVSEGAEDARLSKVLVTIDKNVPLSVSLDDLKFRYPFSGEAKKMLADLEFSSITRRLAFEEDKAEKVDLKVERRVIDEADKLKCLIDDMLDKRVSVVFGDNIYLATNPELEYEIVPQKDLFSGLPYEDILCEIARLFKDVREQIVFDKKGLLHRLNEFNLRLDGAKFDVMVMSHLVSGGKSITTQKAMFEAFGFEGKYPAAEQFALFNKLQADLSRLELDHLYNDIEYPLIRVLYDMECAGFTVDKQVLSQLSLRYSEELDSLTQKIYELAGENFNINSPKQLTAILFEKLMLPAKKKNKSGFSSSVEVLNELVDAHPIVPFVLRYRQISKLQSTYIEGLGKLLNSQNKIHTEFKQTVTSTGRLSSTEPNLQNIPTRTAEGQEIRVAFVPSEGNVLVGADYSQIELRLLAHFSGDERLIEVYRNSEDIHAATAAEIFGVSQSEVTSAMRRSAKAVNFGIIYGISDFGLANNLSVSPKAAKQFIERYFATYPKSKEYMDKNVAFAKEHGYVRTLSGRLRFLPEISSGNFNLRSFGERAAMNMPLQGTAADIIKIAMIKTAEALKGKKSKLILQVHDELIVDTDVAELDEVKKILVDCMENAVSLSVPLTVNVGEGKNWLEAK